MSVSKYVSKVETHFKLNQRPTYLYGTPSVTSMMAWLQLAPTSASLKLSLSNSKATVKADVKLAISSVVIFWTASWNSRIFSFVA